MFSMGSCNWNVSWFHKVYYAKSGKSFTHIFVINTISWLKKYGCHSKKWVWGPQPIIFWNHKTFQTWSENWRTEDDNWYVSETGIYMVLWALVNIKKGTYLRKWPSVLSLWAFAKLVTRLSWSSFFSSVALFGDSWESDFCRCFFFLEFLLVGNLWSFSARLSTRLTNSDHSMPCKM